MMKHKNNRFFITLMVMWCVGIAAHAGSHWTCDDRTYQYDMTAYVQVIDNGYLVMDYSDYEIAAFVGDECRGVAQIVNATKPYGLIRIRSNEVEGEMVTFGVYRPSYGAEIAFEDVALDFSSQGIAGLPSNPVLLKIGNSVRGDVDGDGRVNIDDVTALISLLLSGNASGNLGADADEDGRVNIDDVTCLINYLLSHNW